MTTLDKNISLLFDTTSLLIIISSGLLLGIVIKFYKNPALCQQTSHHSNNLFHRLLRLFLWGNCPSTPSQLTHNDVSSTVSLSRATTSSLSCISHCEKQQQVIKYWFGQYSPDKSQRQLWMIAAASHKQQDKVDAEIFHRFGSLLLELTVASKDSELWHEWCCSDHANHIYGYQGKLAAIIVLDQFSRHVHRFMQRYRYQNTTINDDNSNMAAFNDNDGSFILVQNFAANLLQQSILDDLALQTAQLFLSVHADELNTGMIPTPMFVFACMPLRHANVVGTIRLVQDHIHSMDSLVSEYQSMVARFRKATNRRMAILQDEERRSGTSCLVNDQLAKIQGGKENGNSEVSGETHHTDDDILECAAFQADMITANDHPVYRTIRAFLLNHLQLSTLMEDDKSLRPLRPVLISLSGGVDSMVIASVVARLSNELGLMVVSVHIDYANRPESGAEADFVGRYCQSLGIEFKCRRIDEVTRGVTAREEYEKVARQVRFDFYKQTIKKCLMVRTNGNGNNVEDLIVGVILGHHRGDLRENVLSNAHRGCGPLDLSGMTLCSKNDGVTLFRPLLSLEKTLIFDYAHKFGVPYFKDSTPHWSTRGKLRNKLLPLLEEIYGEGSMNNLSNLAMESDECKALLHQIALEPFLAQVQFKPMGITFGTSSWKSYGPFFWKFVLREALHNVGVSMFTDKSVLSFLDRIKANKLREGWLQCRKDCAVYLCHDGQVHVFFPDSFPWHKSNAYQLENQILRYEVENAVKIGPWTIVAQRLRTQNTMSEDTMHLLNKKAISSIDQLMDGNFEYYMIVPSWQSSNGTFEPRPLVFTKFTKRNRPSAWKCSDSKLQECLPLVTMDEVALAALQDFVSSTATHQEEDGAIVKNPTILVKITLKLARESSEN